MDGDFFKDLGAGVDEIKEKLPGKCDVRKDRDTSQHIVTVRLNDAMTLEFVYNDWYPSRVPKIRVKFNKKACYKKSEKQLELELQTKAKGHEYFNTPMIPMIVDCAEVTATEAPSSALTAALHQTPESGMSDENDVNLWAQPNIPLSIKDNMAPLQTSHIDNVKIGGETTTLSYGWTPEDTVKSIHDWSAVNTTLNYDWVPDNTTTSNFDWATEDSTGSKHDKETKQTTKPNHDLTSLDYNKATNNTTKQNYGKVKKGKKAMNTDKSTNVTPKQNQSKTTEDSSKPNYDKSTKSTQMTNDSTTDDTSARKRSVVELSTGDEWVGAAQASSLNEEEWPELDQPAQDDWVQVATNKKKSKQEQKQFERKVTSAQEPKVNIPRKVKGKKTSTIARPNYFIAVRCTDPAIGNALENVTSEIIAHNPEYEDICYNRNEIHVTLCTLALHSEKEIQRAVKVLNNIRSELIAQAPKQALKIAGISEFNNGKVIYGVVYCPKEFLDFRAFLLSQLGEAGIPPADDDEYVAHMTIGKINNTFLRRVPDVTNFPEDLYKKFLNTTFGFQKVQGIHLCKMGSERREDGFYTCPTEIMFLKH